MRTAPFSKKLMSFLPCYFSFGWQSDLSAVARRAKAEACPPLLSAFAVRWWARRKGAFAHPTHLRRCVGRLPYLVLRIGIEIAGLVTLVQLAGRIARDPVDHASALHRRPFRNRIGPALHVLVF